MGGWMIDIYRIKFPKCLSENKLNPVNHL